MDVPPWAPPWLHKLVTGRRILADIKEHGWRTIGVADTDSSPEFAYTVGLPKTFGHPELLLTGLPRAIAAQVLNGMANQVRKGERRYPAGGPYDHVLQDHLVYAVPVLPENYAAYVGWAMWHHFEHLRQDSTFPVVQVVWPDRETRAFPWDASWPAKLDHLQPLLGPQPETTIH